MTGIGIENTIAVGDSDNDMSMIKAAGLGLAVSNACDELKAIADKVICSNDEHNIKYIYENILNK
jgi:hydroxymethylpyrimidine pyrophosphatase-like HAD family hydrolase